MKAQALFAVVSALQLAVVANAEGLNPRHVGKRQNAVSTPAASSSASVSASATASVVAPATGTAPPPLASGTGVPPLSSISSGMPTRTAKAAATTYTPGSKPPIAGAPALPNPIVPGSAVYPPVDKIPPTDSPEVKEWLKELEGHNIPDLAPTTDGSCGADPDKAADAANRGWWSCGGHTRDTDIVACPDKLTWGVSFDDGPSDYSEYVLDYLKEKDLSATFFVVGSRITQRPALLIEEYMAGHEISVHTWSHSKALTSLTNAELVAELGWTRKIIKDVLGVSPTTMRPPWGDIDDRVRAVSLAMGMVPIIWSRSPSGNTFDTNDWQVAGGKVSGADSFNTFSTILQQASQMETGFIVLQHDLFETTVDLAVGYTLDAALNHNPKFNLKAIGQCQRIPATNLYVETNTNKTFPYPSANGSKANNRSGAVIALAPGSGKMAVLSALAGAALGVMGFLL
ncbi:hypothetical protein CPC08DRAFT_658871 [Agrocybe pediades]|nr:hypothetical protein CPC08DRAFT_658871 [Agrocybe pediades]